MSTLILARTLLGGWMSRAAPDDRRVPIAVLGDSDSHSYHDSIGLPSPGARGGKFRATTLQWTEVWNRLRGEEVDLGEWGVWGTRGRVAWAMRLIGLPGRAPLKEDFRFNFAVSGARCVNLNEGLALQVRPLLDVMHRDSARWSRGLVVVRIGVNDFGQPDALERYATGSVSGERDGLITECLTHIERAISAIRETNRQTRIVLVGILDNADWALAFDRWHDPEQLARISRALDVFDNGLRAIAASEPYIAFHDDRDWWAGYWGTRGTDGSPAYQDYAIAGSRVVITNTRGDHPRNLVVQDGHFGTAGNALWLKSLIELIEDRWSLGLTSISEEEIRSMVEANGAYDAI